MKRKLLQKFFPHDHKPEHVKSLDGLRGIAILIVLLSHGSHFGLHLHPYLNFEIFGKTGVYLFFILSAYLLDRQIILALINKKSNIHYWLNYCLRRFLRIFPLLFFSLVFYYVLNRKYVGNFIFGTEDILNHLLLRQGERFYWSIPVEFKYYLISPILLLLFHRFLKWNLSLIFPTILVLISGSVLYQEVIGFDRLSTLKFFPAFLLGTLLSILEVITTKRILNKKQINILGISSAIILVLMIPYFWKKWWDINLAINKPEYIFPISLLLTFVLFAVKNGEGILKKISESRVLRFFGTISFSLYLFHWIIILFVKKYGYENSFIDTLIYLSISVFLSCLTYLFIEYPFSKIRLKKRIKTTIPVSL